MIVLPDAEDRTIISSSGQNTGMWRKDGQICSVYIASNADTL